MFIRVKVLTGVKKELVKETGANRFEIAVKDKPERNMANTRVLYLLAQHFNVESKKLRIVSGHHSPVKLISIRDDDS